MDINIAFSSLGLSAVNRLLFDGALTIVVGFAHTWTPSIMCVNGAAFLNDVAGEGLTGLRKCSFAENNKIE